MDATIFRKCACASISFAVLYFACAPAVAAEIGEKTFTAGSSIRFTAHNYDPDNNHTVFSTDRNGVDINGQIFLSQSTTLGRNTYAAEDLSISQIGGITTGMYVSASGPDAGGVGLNNDHSVRTEEIIEPYEAIVFHGDLRIELNGHVAPGDYVDYQFNVDFFFQGTTLLHVSHGFADHISTPGDFHLEFRTGYTFPQLGPGVSLAIAYGAVAQFSLGVGKGASDSGETTWIASPDPDIITELLPVPEPSTLALAISLGLTLSVWRRRSIHR